MKVILITILFNSFLFAQISASKIQEYLNLYFDYYDKVEFQFTTELNLNEIVIDNSRSLIHKSDFVYLPVKLRNNGKQISTNIALKVNLFKKVFTAKKEIAFNTILNQEDFEYQLMDVTKVKGNFLNENTTLNNYRTKFTLRKGDILLMDLIDQIPIIKSGDKVVLEVRRGSVEISYQGIARENGKLGEIIDVLADNKELLKAKVISNQKVLVE